MPCGESQNFTPRAQQLLAIAKREARHRNATHVSTEHLLLGALTYERSAAGEALRRAGLHVDSVRLFVGNPGPTTESVSKNGMSASVGRIFAAAARHARELDHSYIGTEHIILALLYEPEGAVPKALAHFRIDVPAVRRDILAGIARGTGLKFYWMVLPGQTDPVRYGVTAFTLEDACRIIQTAGFQVPEDRSALQVQEQVDPNTLNFP